MKTYLSFLKTGLRLLTLQSGLLLCQTLLAAVTFTNTPSVVSNTFGGVITLQIGGLTNGETVVVQKFLDANANGVIGAGDLLVQQFRLTDGQASVFYDGATAVTNINVPGDWNSTTGAITAPLNLQLGSMLWQLVGKYEFKLSSPVGHFTPLTNLFSITNWPYSQSFTGKVVSGAVNVSNAVVLLLSQENGRMQRPIAGTVANNSGAYVLKAPAGTYMILAMKTNYITDFSAIPVLTLSNNATFNTNLNLRSTTRSISGKVVDAADTNTVLPGLFMFAQSTNSLWGVGFSDTNGNFTIWVTNGQWQVQPSADHVPSYGYLAFEDKQYYPSVNTSTGNVTGVLLALPQVTALIYGSITDDQGHPLPGARFGDVNNNINRTDAAADQDGNYALGVIAGNWSGHIDDVYSGYTNYVFSSGFGLSISDGEAIQYNFTALLATNYITGYVKDNKGTNIVGVSLNAGATINGIDYRSDDGLTVSNGNYSINVANGVWTVSVNCEGGEYALNNFGDYHCPDAQTVNIYNNNGVANFVVYPLWIPLISQPARISSTQFGFTFSGSPGTNYTIQASTNLSPANWFTVLITNLSDSTTLIQDNQATNLQRFYRVKVGP